MGKAKFKDINKGGIKSF